MWLIKRIAPSLEYKGETYYFMSSKHKATFEKDPEKFIGGKELMPKLSQEERPATEGGKGLWQRI